MAVLAIRLLPGKQLLIFLLIGTTALLTVFSTPNSISTKLRAVLSGQRGDHETDYADDRFAFWHANWEMLFIQIYSIQKMANWWPKGYMKNWEMNK
jgi:hypothetical protein